MKVIKAIQKGTYFDVFVDDEDFESLSKVSWYVDNKGYARGCVGNKGKFMARLIMEATNPKIFVDHINGNTLDNRRENLRLATNSQNQANRRKHPRNKTGFRGVCFVEHANKYQASIKVNGKSIHLGWFLTAEEAGQAYKNAAEHYFGDYSEHRKAA